uniref:Uncharacterized protein n=1 Tax=Anguilla anguilla TaxID=7936 RepID=A0A0E9UQY4_ANGAN
MVCAVNSSSK